jgi:hypothetical protein
MNLSMAFNIGALARTVKGPSQAQVNQQVSQGAGSSFARDSVTRKSHRQNALNMIGARVGTKRVLDKAGVTKVAAPKKR